MQTNTLAAVSKIAAKITNPTSLAPLYRSLELGKESIRACSEYGNVEIFIEETGLEQPCLLDSVAVQAVAGSLPRDREIALTRANGTLGWKCEAAKGKWTLVQQDQRIPEIKHENFPWTPPAELATALQLAGSACQSVTVSVGLFGITIEPDGDNLKFMSSNSTTLAYVSLPKGNYTAGPIVLRPPVPGLLAHLLRSCPNCNMDITDEGVFLQGDWMLAHLPLGTKLEHDLNQVVARYPNQEQVARIDTVAIRRFLTRAQTLSDKKAQSTVELSVQEGKLLLSHSAVTASSEEYFLAEGLPTDLSYSSVALPIDMLLLPLEHVDSVVLDYLPQNVLVLRGSAPEFKYIVGGQARR